MTEEEIIKAICSSPTEQKKALENLYAHKGPEFKRFYRYKGLSVEDTSELLQEVILKIFTNAKQYTGQGAYSDNSANAWMWMIARNVLNDYFTKINKNNNMISGSINDLEFNDKNTNKLLQSEISLIKEKDTRETEIAIEECVSKGIEEFNSLFPDRANVILMQIDGMRIESIAKIINRTSDATKVYISECKKKLIPYISHCHSLMITG
jgi:RNA polymerase sigma factor (sigma-70 family)